MTGDLAVLAGGGRVRLAEVEPHRAATLPSPNGLRGTGACRVSIIWTSRAEGRSIPTGLDPFQGRVASWRIVGKREMARRARGHGPVVR